MSNIIDRRQGGKNRLSGSRHKFIDRYKRSIKQHIDSHIKNTDIKKIGKKVKVRVLDMGSSTPHYDRSRSIYKNVHPGNKSFEKGDIINLPKSGKKAMGGGNGPMEQPEFVNFILSKEEFLDLLFEDMELPNFVKQSEKYISKSSLITGGYTKVGVPARLAIKKTFENAIRRRIALKDSHIGRLFLDDIDIRYRDLVEIKRPVTQAVMFCVLDVSGSMYDSRKLIAKKFFLLLYLFLHKNYQHVEIRFIAHTTEAFELPEESFFNCEATGGTVLSSPIKYINKIIDEEYDIEYVNIYIAQASDGENWTSDYPVLKDELTRILPKIQYFAYIEVDQERLEYGATEFFKKEFSVPKVASVAIAKLADVYDSLRKLFTAGDK